MKILVVYKRSNLETYAQTIRVKQRPLKRRIQAILAKSHKEHLSALLYVKNLLHKNQIAADFVLRDDLKNFNESKYDFILTIGGDGTLLWVASFVKDKPILALNSSPMHSVGFFAAATIKNIDLWLKKIIEKKVLPKQIARMQVKINKRNVLYPVLNEVLFAHHSPAATSRYVIKIKNGKMLEEQRSSGVWIATAAGSTAAIRSAGGKVLPILSKKIQFLVREPYVQKSNHYQLKAGFIQKNEKMVIESRTLQGTLFFEGQLREIEISFGDVMEFSLHQHHLNLFLN